MASTCNFVIFYEGVKKTIKAANPNALMQTVLVDAAAQFGQDVNHCSLKYKKTTIDCSHPIRFCNLSNNVQLDLIVSKPKGGGMEQQTKIALSYTIGNSTTGTITTSANSSSSLYQWITQLVGESKLPAEVLSGSLEVIYMRTGFNTIDSLQQTTFHSLGLGG